MIGLDFGYMDYYGIGYSNIRLPNSSRSYIYKYDTRINKNSVRTYIFSKNFSFENKFSITVSNIGIISNLFATSTTSNNIKLMNKSSLCKPFIVFDSVGRLRFSN